jgi:hypothetical protein
MNIILIKITNFGKETLMIASKNQSPSGLAIAALVTGLLGMSIIPIILGAIDLGKIKKGEAGSAGRGFDIAGIVLGSIWTVVWLVMVIVMTVVGSGLLFNIY